MCSAGLGRGQKRRTRVSAPHRRVSSYFPWLKFVNLGRRNACCRHFRIGFVGQASETVCANFGCTAWVARPPNRRGCHPDFRGRRHGAPSSATAGRLQLPVLVVPHGSGNDFARALDLRSPSSALRAWQQFVSGRGNVRQIDLGVITPTDAGGAPAPHEAELRRYFCCVGGVGLDAEVARRANQLPAPCAAGAATCLA